MYRLTVKGYRFFQDRFFTKKFTQSQWRQNTPCKYMKGQTVKRKDNDKPVNWPGVLAWYVKHQNVSATVKKFGVSRQAFYKHIKKSGIALEEVRDKYVAATITRHLNKLNLKGLPGKAVKRG